jgi:prolyl oligopeptidase
MRTVKDGTSPAPPERGQKKIAHSCLLAVVLGAASGASAGCGANETPVMVPPPPPAPDAASADALRPGAVRELIHGTRVDDPFRWLEDEKSPETQAFVDKQAAALGAYYARIPGREALEKEVAALAHVGHVGAPSVEVGSGGKRRYFHTKRSGTQDQPTLYVRDGALATDRPLIEASTLSPDGTIALDWWYPSHGGAFVAWGRSESGNEESTLVIRDVVTGKDLADRISRTRHASVAWLPNAKAFYYSRYPAPGTVPAGEERYHDRIYRHEIGTDPDQDPLVFGAGRDKTDVPQVMISPNGRWLVVRVHEGWAKSEVYLRDLKAGDKAPWIEVAVKTDARFDPIPLDDRLYIFTNDGAPRYRLFSVDYTKADRTNWKEIISEGNDVLTDVEVAGDTLIASYLHDASSRIALFSLDGKPKGDIPLPGIGSAGVTAPVEGGEAFVSFVSFTTPSRILRVELAKAKGKGAKEPPTPVLWDSVSGEFSTEGIAVSRLVATSKDGTPVPMFMIAKEPLGSGAPPPGVGPLPGVGGRGAPRPTLLWGYGGFSVNQTPAFSSRALVMANHGGVFVSAVLRGGGEMGEAWHRGGMLENKQNVFDDFYACAEELIARGITTPEKLAIGGGSNGGLLTSVAITQHPELFRAALSLVPLTDMIRYPRFLIAKLWIPEYGDPERPEDFKWLYAYSPYHHVKDSKDNVVYPAVFFATAVSDARVDPMHARKMAARLLEAQAAKDRPILLRVESKAGHGAGKPVSKVIVQTADELAFVLHELGAL